MNEVIGTYYFSEEGKAQVKTIWVHFAILRRLDLEKHIGLVKSDLRRESEPHRR